METWELTTIRSDFQSVLMTDRADFYRRSGTSDPYGGGLPDWSPVVSMQSVPVHVVPLIYPEVPVGSRDTGVTRFTLTFPYGTDARVGDLLIVQGFSLRIDAVGSPETQDLVLLAQATRVDYRDEELAIS